MTVLVVWVRGQVPRSGIARVVVSKGKDAIHGHIVVGIFESDDTGTQLKKFFEVQYCSVGKCR